MNWAEHNQLEFEEMGRIQAVQQVELVKHLCFAAGHSPYYKDLFRQLQLNPATLRAEHLQELPFTTKAELESRNDDFLAVPMSRIADIVLSSGTSGLPTRIMYTRGDLARLAYNEKQSFAGCGVTAEDVVLLTCTLDRCFVAGLAYFLGLNELGAASIRNGHGTMEGHCELIERMKPTVIVGVPTFLRKLGYYLVDHGVDPAQTSVKKMVCIGEPLRNRSFDLLELGHELESLWRARVYSTYASSEMITTFCECTAQRGGHLHPELAVIEIVDEAGRVLGDQEVGEVVVTPLGVEGMPLIRFRTGDVSFLESTPCDCGRNSPRLGPVLGRRNQMLKVKGTTLYPPAINAVMDATPEVLEYYVTVDDDSELSDCVTVHAAVRSDCEQGAKEMLCRVLQSRLRVTPGVCIETEADIRRVVHVAASRKPIRFIDRRKKQDEL